jgi:hypothetical protein
VDIGGLGYHQCFVDIGGLVYHQCFVDIGGLVYHQCFVDIGGLAYHQYLNFHFIEMTNTYHATQVTKNINTVKPTTSPTINVVELLFFFFLAFFLGGLE